MTKSKLPKIASIVMLAFVVAVAIAANIVLGVFADTITRFFYGMGTSEVSAETLAAGNALSEEIADEGIVLLKNRDDALPLHDIDKVNLFGWASTQVVTTGTGSGNILTGNEATIPSALQSEGIAVNPALWDKYVSYKSTPRNKSAYIWEVNWSLWEPALSTYSDRDWADYQAYSDVALFVIARLGGEDHDLPVGYLGISDTEKALLDNVKQKFGTVIVVVNSCNAMELGFLDDDRIDAALAVGAPGESGINSMAKVLTGKVNPSGRTVDTYAYDSTTSPAYGINEFGRTFSTADSNVSLLGTGVRTYADSGVTGDDQGAHYHYIEYNEGIYVGYRYYETRYAAGSSSRDATKKYEEVVQFPFGYGLSYTDFKWEVVGATENAAPLTADGKISVDVKVTNVGNRAGKDVVQLYYTAPYNVGGVEKSYVELVGFAKTKLLQPAATSADPADASDVVTIGFAARDMASYDEKGSSGFNGYVLEKGTYSVRVMRNAHDLPVGGDADDFVIDYDAAARIDYPTDAATGHTIKNRFVGDDTYDGVSADGRGEETPVRFVSRCDWEGTFPDQDDLSGRSMTAAALAARSYVADDTEADKQYAAFPVFGKNNGLHIDDFRDTPYDPGADWDGPTWDDLIDQMTLQEAVDLIRYGGHKTKPVKSIGKFQANDMDGPQGLNMHNTSSVPLIATAYPSPTNIAQAWSLDLAYRMGKSVGREGQECGISGWYAPGVNIHRSPYSGRNFEYYSEDPLVSGLIGAAVVDGASDEGMYCYVKHFAVNDVETWRAGKNGLYTWATEQAIREIYIRPFELTVKVGGTLGIMSSFNRIGATWAGGSYGLLTEVLRDEWGFTGTVNTDYYMNNSYPYMNVAQGLRAGGDMWLTGVESYATAPETKTKTDQWMIRRAVKNILYTYSHSKPVEVKMPAPLWWIYVALVEAALLAGAGVWVRFMLRRKKNKNDKASNILTE